MQEIDVNKAVITAINVIVLLGLPVTLGWHISQVKTKRHLSDDWIIQLLIVFLYATAICAEIPALWARFDAYYIHKMIIPDSLYKLTTWDRFNHLFFYAIFIVFTVTVTRKTIPKVIRETLQ